MTECPSWHQPTMAMGTIIFIETLSPGELPTKAEEWFTCPWDEDYTQPGIKMIFQEVSGVKPAGILISKPKKWPPSSIKKLLQILKRYC